MDVRAISSTAEIVGVLNGLLRGELAAVESYRVAIEKLAGQAGTKELQHIRSEHLDAVQALRAHVIELGGTPDTSAGPWGAFARAVEGAATLLGGRLAMQALKAGEETGAASYESALGKDLPSMSFALIHSRLLPQTREHVTILDDYLLRSPEH